MPPTPTRGRTSPSKNKSRNSSALRQIPGNVAAIDIGTNSFHLIIGRITGERGRFVILDKEKEIVRLGSGSTDMKHLSEGAINRAIHSLQRFKGLADAFAAPVRAVATSAVREAVNQDIFLRRVKAETGIVVEVISGTEEARLIYLGILQALPVFDKKILLLDIGGGSTEFLIGQRGRVRYANSLKLGAVRLTERFFRSEKITKKQIAECRAFIRGMLSPIVRAIHEAGFQSVVGSSGTTETLAQMIKARRGESWNGPVNNFTFTRRELLAIVEDILKAETPATRFALEGIDPGRADIITAGALILEQTFREFKLKELTVSESALREGILLDTHHERRKHAQLQYLSDLRYGSVLHLAETFHYEEKHAHHVAALAGEIFESTQKIHKLGEAESEFLEAAALLHEIGFFIAHDQHHRHSYYLIRNAEMPGFTENEKEIVANIARYHRKSHPKQKHDTFSKLVPQDQEIVLKLSAILRVADGLDRTHQQRVRSVKARCAKKSVSFSVKLRGKKDQIDIWGAEQKKALFEEAFKVKVKFRVTKG